MQQTEQNTNLSALVPLIQKKLGANIQDTLTGNEQAEISKLALDATDLDQVVGGMKPETKEKVKKYMRIGGEGALAIVAVVLGCLYANSCSDNAKLSQNNAKLSQDNAKLNEDILTLRNQNSHLAGVAMGAKVIAGDALKNPDS